MGRGVRVGRLGTFRVVLKSDGADAPEKFNVNLIHHVKLQFSPNSYMKKQLEDISYEMVK